MSEIQGEVKKENYMAQSFYVRNGKIKGTSKRDKIIWKGQWDWQRPLTVKAGKGSDIINFAASYFNKNKLYGEAGNDKILGGTKADYINGGIGNDTLLGNSGDDQIHLGYGYDLADGGNGDDKIWCEKGVNAVTGGSGHDTIYGGVGYDAIDGGKGNDIIFLKKVTKNYKSIKLKLGSKTVNLSEKLRTYVIAGVGHDKILDIQGGAIVYGGVGMDTITAISGNNTLYGGASNDSITGGTGNDYIDGGDGRDVIIAKGGDNTIFGGASNDSIKSGKGNDFIDGGIGEDTIIAQGGDNTILGGASNDTITAGYGNDSIDGGDGRDIIVANGGNNTIYGGGSNDSITAGDGDDVIYGNAHSDTINAGGGTNTIGFNPGDGYDVIISGGGDDNLLFADETFDTCHAKYSDNGLDLILKTDNGKNTVVLQDFAKGHSVKKVSLGSITYSIEELLPPSASLSLAPKTMARNVESLVSDVASWSSSTSDYSALPDYAGCQVASTEDIAQLYINNQPY